jgi:hypothetical protein
MFQVSWSKISLWRKCRQAYHYRYDQNLDKKAPAVYLIKGNVLGEMLDARAQAKDASKVLDVYAKKYASLFVEEQEMHGNFVEDVERIYAGYCREYADEKLKYIAVEMELKVKLTLKIEFIGYIDKLVRDSNKQIWIMDHKSMGSIPDENNRYSDLQQVFYGWSYNQTVKPKLEASGIIWDYLRTKPPTIPETLKNGQLTVRANIDTDYYTYKSEINRLGLKMTLPYAETLERLKAQPSKFFQRVQLPLSNSTMVSQVVEDLTHTAEEIFAYENTSGTAPHGRNMTRDCPQCTFFELCQSELRGYDSAFIRKTKYVTREENPRGKKVTV